MTAGVQMKFKCTITLMSSMLLLSACGIFGHKPKVMLPSVPPPKPSEKGLVVALQPTDVVRVSTHITLDQNGLPSFETPEPEKLVRGDVAIGGEKCTFYIPLYGPHPLTSKDNHSFENTSTQMSVDVNHDGDLDRSENWWSSLPVRLGDQMFDVKGIDPGSKWILFGKSSAPLSGLVVGKPCPGFQFVTTDGKPVDLADYKGKALLIDVWSMT